MQARISENREESIDEQFTKLLEAGDSQVAMTMIGAITDYHDGERIVIAALRQDNAPEEIVEASLEMFLKIHEKNENKPQHGYWVHSLSHFTGILWERRMDDWTKKFNEVAFRGAKEFRDDNCSSRLVGDFAQHARWNDDPADFHLAPENLTWMDWEYMETARRMRILEAPFESEQAYLQWQLRQPEIFYLDYYNRVDVEKLKADIGRLEELGEDINEFASLEHTLLTKQLQELEDELAKCPSSSDMKRRSLEKTIQKTRGLLEV